jgi:AraC-like DNA-binding protein
MLPAMATSTTALRFAPEPVGPFERLRDMVLDLATADGHTALLAPDICLYRFSGATTFTKAATFGVTLGVVLQGAKRFRFDTCDLTVDPSRLIVFTRETEHQASVVEASRQRPFVGLGFCFGPERVARALLALAEAGGRAAPESVPAFLLPCEPEIGDVLERLLRTLSDPLDRKLIAPLVMDEILFRLLRTEAAATIRSGVGPGADAERILGAMQFIRQNHADKLSVDQLARASAMSASHFAHRFRAVARVSPMRYLRDVRLDVARARLLGNGARVGQVAVDVGFESPAHFTREFKRRFGVSPSKSLGPLSAR